MDMIMGFSEASVSASEILTYEYEC